MKSKFETIKSITVCGEVFEISSLKAEQLVPKGQVCLTGLGYKDLIARVNCKSKNVVKRFLDTGIYTYHNGFKQKFDKLLVCDKSTGRFYLSDVIESTI